MMKRLALIGLLFALTCVALVLPSGDANAFPTPLSCDECVSQLAYCDQECYSWYMPGNLPAYQACQADCRRAFRSCRIGCTL
jgi:hypothetical protein